jgi:hypothetical protein
LPPLYAGELDRDGCSYRCVAPEELELLDERFASERAQAGRSDWFPRGAWLVRSGDGPGLFERPKPCGARPRSVVLPCADQLRVFAGRFAELPTLALAPADARSLAPTPAPADGGLLLESSRWRVLIAGLMLLDAPPRLPADGALGDVPRPPKLLFELRPTSPVTRALLLTRTLPARPAESPVVFMVRTGMCAAA